LLERDPTWQGTPRCDDINDPRLPRLLDKLAVKLRRHGADVLRGDFAIFPRLRQRAEENLRRTNKELFGTEQPQRELLLSVYWNELLDAVNVVRAANGDSPVTWPTGYPAPVRGVLIYGAHLTMLRSEMDGALSRLGVNPTPYTDPTISRFVLIRAVHVQELQNRTR
jgi:hypothetical protein